MENFKDKLNELLEFCKKNKRVPSKKVKDESRLADFMYKYINHPKINKIRNYVFTYKYSYNLSLLKSYCEENNKLPGLDNRKLYNFYRHNRSKSEINQLFIKYSKQSRSISENLIDLKDYCEKNGKLPNDGGKREVKLKSFIRNHMHLDEVKEMVNKYRRPSRSFDDEFHELVLFVMKNNRLPQSRFNKTEGRLRAFMSNHMNHPDIMNINIKYRRRS